MRDACDYLAQKTEIGATGIQVVPWLAKYSAKLYVFQRTPSAVDIRRNEPTTRSSDQSNEGPTFTSCELQDVYVERSHIRNLGV